MSHKVHFHLESVELLFEGWKVSSASDVAIAGVTGALLAVLYEASKLIMLNLIIVSPARTTFRLRVLYHASRTLLHMVQLGMGYLLMLMVMTFNFWIMLSILAGTGVGYLSCAWTLINVKHETPERAKSRTPNHEKQRDDFNKQTIRLQLESSL